MVRKDASAQRTLFDIISEKIDKKKWEVETQLSQTSADDIVVFFEIYSLNKTEINLNLKNYYY